MANQLMHLMLSAPVTVGPLSLRVLLDGTRIVHTEILLAGREWSEDKLLMHEQAWYSEVQANLPELVAQAVGGGT